MKASASPPVQELLLPTGLWIHFLMLPFQNKHSSVRMRAETERDGRGAGGLHLVGRWRASMEPPQHTKLTLCKISGGHQEGPTAIFSQSEAVCFLWASEPECVSGAGRCAGKHHWGRNKVSTGVGCRVEGFLNISFDYACLRRCQETRLYVSSRLPLCKTYFSSSANKVIGPYKRMTAKTQPFLHQQIFGCVFEEDEVLHVFIDYCGSANAPTGGDTRVHLPSIAANVSISFFLLQLELCCNIINVYSENPQCKSVLLGEGLSGKL